MRDSGALARDLFQIGVFALAMPYRVRWTPVSIPLAAHRPVGLGAACSEPDHLPLGNWNAVLTWTTQLVCFLLAFQLFADERNRNWFLRALFYFGFALSVISTLQLFTSQGKVFWIFPSGYKDMVLGPFVYHNQYAAFVEMVFPLAVVAALQSRERALIYGGMAAVLYASVIASASRAGTALVTLELIAILLLAVFQRRSRCEPPDWLGLLRDTRDHFHRRRRMARSVGQAEMPDPFVTRRELLHSTLDMIHERPAMGFGWEPGPPRILPTPIPTMGSSPIRPTTTGRSGRPKADCRSFCSCYRSPFGASARPRIRCGESAWSRSSCTAWSITRSSVPH